MLFLLCEKLSPLPGSSVTCLEIYRICNSYKTSLRKSSLKAALCVRKFSVAPGSCGQVGPCGQNVLEQDCEPWKPLFSRFLMNSSLDEWLARCILASITTSLTVLHLPTHTYIKVLKVKGDMYKCILLSGQQLTGQNSNQIIRFI